MQFLAANECQRHVSSMSIQMATGRAMNRPVSTWEGSGSSEARFRTSFYSNEEMGWVPPVGESEDPWPAVHVSPSVFIQAQAISSPVVTELLVNLQSALFGSGGGSVKACHGRLLLLMGGQGWHRQRWVLWYLFLEHMAISGFLLELTET